MVMYLLGTKCTHKKYIYDSFVAEFIVSISSLSFSPATQIRLIFSQWLSACQHALSPSCSVKIIYVTETVYFMFVSHLFNS